MSALHFEADLLLIQGVDRNVMGISATDDTFYGVLGVPSYTIDLGISFFEDCATFEAQTYPTNSAALLYASCGWHVFPLIPGTKSAGTLSAPAEL